MSKKTKAIKATKVKALKKLRDKKADVAIRVLNDSNAYVTQPYSGRSITHDRAVVTELTDLPMTELHLTSRHIESLCSANIPVWVSGLLQSGISDDRIPTVGLYDLLLLSGVSSDRLSMVDNHIQPVFLTEDISDEVFSEYRARKMCMINSAVNKLRQYSGLLSDMETPIPEGNICLKGTSTVISTHSNPMPICRKLVSDRDHTLSRLVTHNADLQTTEQDDEQAAVDKAATKLVNHWRVANVN